MNHRVQGLCRQRCAGYRSPPPTLVQTPNFWTPNFSTPTFSTPPLPQNSAKGHKSKLRKQLRNVRTSLTPAFQHNSAEAAAALLAAQPIWTSARSIGLYSAINHELDCTAIARAAWRSGKEVYLPCVRNNNLEFRLWSIDDRLVTGAYGIMEPRDVMHQARALDLLVTPLVGWSISGQRLGMGAGYYDRLLADNRFTVNAAIGLGYECQRADEIDNCAEPWDQRLAGMLTETQFYQVGQKRS